MKYVFSQNLIHPEAFRQKLLSYVTVFDPCICLDSNSHLLPEQRYGTYDFLAAMGKRKEYKGSGASLLKTLRDAISQNREWLFGYLAYDTKNMFEDLRSDNFDGTGFPDIYFFQPEIVFIIRHHKIEIHSDVETVASLQKIYKTIKQLLPLYPASDHTMKIMNRMSMSYYIKGVKEIQHHINRGDIYEMNFCQEFYSENADINPYSTYLMVNSVSPAPFSSYLVFDHKYLICGSPERFLKKRGQMIISQPMKGTVRRGDYINEDRLLKQKLFSDPKERAENIMIVDLVRNDLSKTALRGSVKVEELCGVYTFNLWHQMISTIMSEVPDYSNPLDILTGAFPMGSMTGAPKIKAMQLIEEFELTRRGLYSGTLGYFSPDGDFDFNVVIRSVLFNAKNKYLSFQTGGAITALSDPGKEYDECILKAGGLMNVLHANECKPNT